VRIKSVADLPQPARSRAQAALAKLLPLKRAKAAETLRLEQFREQRERLTLAMLKQLEYLNLAILFEREYKFHPERQWRLDLYARCCQLGIELHGGIHSNGRHVRGQGFIDDREKMNAATELGISVFEFWPEAIADGSAAAQVERFISLVSRP